MAKRQYTDNIYATCVVPNIEQLSTYFNLLKKLNFYMRELFNGFVFPFAYVHVTYIVACVRACVLVCVSRIFFTTLLITL